MSLGHRRIGFVRPVAAGLVHLRETHYKDFLRQHQLTLPEASIIDILDRDEGAVRNELETLLSPNNPHRPTAFLCGNDHVALMLMKQTGALGLKIPQDLSIVGFDNLRFVEHLSVPLTTVDQPKQEMGRRAAEMLFERINTKATTPARYEVFRPHLIIRDSCAVPPTAPPQSTANR
jgi:DNA-binding LacI/PurR family transcriptional regulator